MMQQLGPTVVNLRHWLANQPGLPPLSRWTLKRMLKKAGFRWKRVRKSLKDRQDAVLMAFFKQELAHLLEAHRQGQLALWFYDESGLGLNPAGLYAWQAAGSAVCLPAQRGEGFTVAGFLSADQTWQAFSYAGPTTSEAFIRLVDEWIAQHLPTGKTVLVLDNASFPCSSQVRIKGKEWARQQVYLQYLPAYGSELNRIETLWHHLKHQWLEVEAYANAQTLRQAVESILRQFGEKYTITFA